jgi:tripartite-type tricarboxylate transporter receptor subunit TctC
VRECPWQWPIIAVLSILLAVASPAATGQAYPARPVRVVVPSAPGGSPDFLARVIFQKLAEFTGQQFVVDNRAGASGVIGTEIVARSAPDGYTLLLGGSLNIGALPVLKARLPFDAERDFVTVGGIAWAANVVGVHPAVPVSSVAELIQSARSRPLNFGSAGNGSPAHLGGELFNVLAGVRMVHVPYKGAGPAATDLIAGQIQVFFGSPLVLVPLAQNGRVKVIATTGAARDPLLPQLPTVAETLPGFEVTQWWGVMAPARVSPPVIERLNRELNRALLLPDVQEKLRQQGTSVLGGKPDALAKRIADERARIARIARQADIRLDD